MKIGTKSVLYGAHCFIIHPFFVAAAWWKLYGFPFDYRLWVAFFVHDLGYWGKPNMDGVEGETHPELGGRIMHKLFDKKYGRCKYEFDTPCKMLGGGCFNWYEFCVYHSRFYADKDKAKVSRLCYADKLAVVLTPTWLYLPMVNWTGEIKEYLGLTETRYKRENLDPTTQEIWFKSVKRYLKLWVEQECKVKL